MTSNLSNPGLLDIWALEAREIDGIKIKKTQESSAKDILNACINGLVKGSYLILPEHVPFVVCCCFELYGTLEGNVFKWTVNE